ncbi:MAG: dTMP kinase [Proteobacteria bacterium]|nr:dTMP kinase [Pseudomonadota bacterium]
MQQGHYIAIEGPDGAGKSTQLKFLEAAFRQASTPYLAVREPGATDIGKEIRQILLTGHADKLDATTEVLLFSADRRHTIRTLIRPALAAGKFVLSDRTYLSTLVFQGYSGGLPVPMLEELTRVAVEDTVPELMLVLDLPVEVGLGRKNPQFALGLDESRMESKGTAYHESNRKGYLAEVKKHPTTHTVINADQSQEAVHAAILVEINARFGLSLQPGILPAG